MRFIEICVFVLVHLLVIDAQWSIGGEDCRTPDDQPGYCITVYSCKHVMDVINVSPKSIPPKIRNLLKLYQCGFSAREPKVCCPPTPIIVEGVTITTTVPTPPSSPPDVSQHRNIGLLPRKCGILDTDVRIVNGDKTGLFEYPWMALLFYRTTQGPEFKCAGTIINDKYILTAAHCLTNERYSLIQVRVGEHNTETPVDCEVTNDNERICAPPFQSLAVEQIIPHPQYNPKTRHNDIGLVRVSPMDLSAENVKPVCLPLEKTRTFNFTNRRSVVTGWGATETGRPSPELLQVQIPVVPNEECAESYKNVIPTQRVTIHQQQMCAGGKTSSDTCNGDSGGPLQVVATLHGDSRIVQQGVVSFGPLSCAKRALPTVYARVAYYMDWILDNMRP